MNDSGSGADRRSWTPYAPDPAPPNAGECSWCGQYQAPDNLVVMNGDGSAGICEECTNSHTRFFARRRSR
jgi:hypothetical protein